MHSFRTRYIVLGLLVYIQSACCRICGSDFHDVPSSSVRADIVFDGTATANVVSLTPGQPSGLSVVQFKVRRVFKGELPLRRPDRWRPVWVGPFSSSEDAEQCISSHILAGGHYIIFLNNQTSHLLDYRSGRSSQSPDVYFTFSALPTNYSDAKLRLVRDSTCDGCARAPRVVLNTERTIQLREGAKLSLQCRVQSGKPEPKILWYKNGLPVDSHTPRISVRESRRRRSRLRIKTLRHSDGGNYSCRAQNVIGRSELQTASVLVTPVEWSDHDVPCERPSYCLNGGTCSKNRRLNIRRCRCLPDYAGRRCAQPKPFVILREAGIREQQRLDRTMTFTGLAVGVVILAVICIVSYFLAKKTREEREKRRKSKKSREGNNKGVSATKVPLLNGAADTLTATLSTERGIQTDDFSRSVVNGYENGHATTPSFPLLSDVLVSADVQPLHDLPRRSHYDNEPDSDNAASGETSTDMSPSSPSPPSTCSSPEEETRLFQKQIAEPCMPLTPPPKYHAGLLHQRVNDYLEDNEVATSNV